MRIQDKAIYNELIAYEMPEVELPERRNRQIRMIEDKLESLLELQKSQELQEDKYYKVIPERPSHIKTVNRFYYNDSSDAVLCVIDRSKMTRKVDPDHVDKNKYYIVMDKNAFDNFVTRRDAKFNITTGNFPLVYASFFNEEKEKIKEIKGECAVRIQGNFAQIAVKEDLINIIDEDGNLCPGVKANGKKIEVDHITHNRFINMRKYLRECTSLENNRNKRSCRENTEYNPLVDFSETWYALVFEELFQKISSEERKEYQRDYFVRQYKRVYDKDPYSEETKELQSFLSYYLPDEYKRLMNK